MRDFTQNIVQDLIKKLDNIKDYNSFLSELEKEYSFEDILECYKYILENSSDFKLVDKIIRKINSQRKIEFLSLLIDFILLPKANNSFLDLKVLAIKTISNYSDKTAVSALMYCLNNKESNYKIRFAAAEALGKIGDKNAFESLTNIVYDDKEKSAYMKESAVTALGMLGDNRALDVFSSIINTKEMFLSKFSYLKERIIEAMTKLDVSKNKKAFDILKESLMDSSKQVRINSIEAIMNSNMPESYELIYDRLKYDDDFEVQQNALVALYNISDRRILDKVIKGEFSDELKIYAKELIDEYEENDD